MKRYEDAVDITRDALRTWEVMVCVTVQPSRIPAAKLLLQVAGHSLGQKDTNIRRLAEDTELNCMISIDFLQTWKVIVPYVHQAFCSEFLG